LIIFEFAPIFNSPSDLFTHTEEKKTLKVKFGDSEKEEIELRRVQRGEGKIRTMDYWPSSG
jgi:hypothetical protein